MTVVETRLDEIEKDILFHMKRQWADVLLIGERAAEAKALLPHGDYTPWIETKLHLPPRLIRSYVNVYERLGKSAEFAALSVSAGLLLAAPSVPDGLLQEVADRLATGEKMTVNKIESLIDQYKVMKGAQIGATAILEQFGSKEDGTPVSAIPRSAVTSLLVVTENALQTGTVEINGKDYHPTLPPAVVAAVTQETRRRQDEHIADSIEDKKTQPDQPVNVWVYRASIEKSLANLKREMGDEWLMQLMKAVAA